jgi:hypothetical protein
VHGNVAVTAFVCDKESEHGQDQRSPAWNTKLDRPKSI